MTPALRISFAVIAYCIATCTGSASNPERQLLFSITAQKTARLGIINTTKKPLDLTIANDYGEVFYTKTIKGENNYFQLLDLAAMNNGKYIIKATDGTHILEKKFVVANSEAKIIPDKLQSKPRFHMPDTKTLIVNYQNTSSNAVNIFFMIKDEVIFEDRGISEPAISKKYSLQKLPAGEYVVKLYSGGDIFTYPLNLN